MFRGSIVALVTPFDSNGEIDVLTLRKLIEWHINQGTDGILLAGCTGENFTLEENELDLLLKTGLEVAKGKIPIILGTGSSSTAEAVRRTKIAKQLGADAVLVITPYGNKPSQNGLYEYYREIAEIGIPVILYNVPSRTGTNLLPETVVKLASMPNIVAIKEASGNLDQVSAILRDAPRFCILSGDDSLTLPMLAIGAKGVVSTVANIAPKDFADMVRAFENGDLKKAQEIHLKLFPVIKALFLEGNPTPLKSAMEMMGLCSSRLRPPLAKPSEKTIEALRKSMKDAGLI